MAEGEIVEPPKPIAYTPVSRVRGDVAPRVKQARGFSLGELKEAGFPIDLARRLGIYVDKRRDTVWPENVNALKNFLEAYKSGKVVVPPKKKRPKKGSPQKGRVFRGLTPAGRKARGLVKSRYKETHRYKWKRKQRRGPRKTPSFYYHD